jgi:hypothetical protein
VLTAEFFKTVIMAPKQQSLDLNTKLEIICENLAVHQKAKQEGELD